MKPIVEYLEYSGSAWIRLASRFATKVDNDANIFRFDGGSARLTVRVAAGLLDKLLDEGKLYAMESTTKPLFVARFRHQGSWYIWSARKRIGSGFVTTLWNLHPQRVLSSERALL
jgi:hypothetical protein